ncbi:MAG: hypothetical protein ACREBU_12405 [Nitrososphaera sp.]
MPRPIIIFKQNNVRKQYPRGAPPVMFIEAVFEPAIPSLGSSYLNQAGLTSHCRKLGLMKIKAFTINV